jgi:hypothetical protein
MLSGEFFNGSQLLLLRQQTREERFTRNHSL